MNLYALIVDPGALDYALTLPATVFIDFTAGFLILFATFAIFLFLGCVFVDFLDLSALSSDWVFA